MNFSLNIDPIKQYFQSKLNTYGTTPRGADWKSEEAQFLRFNQLIKVINPSTNYSLLDFGSGYGALYDYLKKLNHKLEYFGLDIVDDMISEGRKLHQDDPFCHFMSDESEIPEVDYSIVSGTFNIKLDSSNDAWKEYILKSLTFINKRTYKGFAFNLLTKYSDPEFMRNDLYYADPCFFFDFCKQNFAKDVALLHDYGMYDFTIIVRKVLE